MGRDDDLGFEPAPRAPAQAASSQPPVSVWDAIKQGARTGITWGSSDELSGLLGASMQAGDKLANKVGLHNATHLGITDKDGKQLSIPDAYRTERDAERQADSAAADAHPWAHGVAEAVAAIPGIFVAPEVKAAGAGLGSRLAAAGATGAIQGGIQAFNHSDADLTRGRFGQSAKDTALGAGIGGAAGTAVHSVTEAINPEELAKFAQGRAFKAAGGSKPFLKTLGLDRAREVAQDLLDSGAVGPASTKEAIQKAIADQLPNAEARVGSLIDQADNATGGRSFDMKTLISRARNELLAPLAGDPARAAHAAALKELIDGYEAQSLGGVDFGEANAWKQSLWKSIKNFRDTPFAQEARRDLGSLFRNELERQTEGALGSGAGAELADANRLWGNLIEGQGLAENGVASEMGNRWLSPSDHAIGIGGAMAAAASGHPGMAIPALGLGVANKVAREYGPSFLASTANAAAKGMESVASKPLVSIVQRAAAAEPALLGRWGPTLTRALQGGPDEFAASHYVLSQTDPDYQRHIQGLTSASNERDGN